MATTVNQLKKGDVITFATGKRTVESCVRLSLLSRGKSMSKSYAQTHCEVRFSDGHEVIWNANTRLG